MNKQQRILVLATILFVVVMMSAIGMVYSKHKTRMLFVELQQLNKEVVSLNTEWGRLQLEQSAWSDHSRIERIARERLGMVTPEAGQIAFIRP
ncbi:MAG: cell division protein FtsL [Thiotrichales bacterium]|nr:MAG: cell division protein FtsL [Thiotrichales bacterium]